MRSSRTGPEWAPTATVLTSPPRAGGTQAGTDDDGPLCLRAALERRGERGSAALSREALRDVLEDLGVLSEARGGDRGGRTVR